MSEPTPDRLLLDLGPTGYRWSRIDTNNVTLRSSVPYRYEADCFDAMIDANPDHSYCKIEFDDHAAVAEGGVGAPHVKPPVPGYPLAPGQWSRTDPERGRD